MSLSCFNCGASLEALSLPLQRLDTCTACGRYLHVCRMCVHYDPAETSKNCREDDAEKVHDKMRANFCDFFSPTSRAVDAAAVSAEQRARAQLANLFGDGDVDDNATDAGGAANAEALFRSD